jgi:rare lipoprotein A
MARRRPPVRANAVRHRRGLAMRSAGSPHRTSLTAAAAASLLRGGKDEHCNSTGNGVLKKLLLAATVILPFFHGLQAVAGEDIHPAAARFSAEVTAQVGVASWYGGSHAGRLTANGERFNPRALTCAHRTLPLGSVVTVTSLATGTSVTCRVNDRGPYIRGRILDLSEQAAIRLGVGDQGLLRVRIETVSSEEPG